MAFPGTYNFSYYQGDTYEFKIYPKNSIGGTFDLSNFQVQFYVATSRGSNATQYQCQATINLDSSITCIIPPGVGRSLTAGTNYVYDVEVRRASDNTIHTLLTGTISVTADVSGAI